MKDIIWNNLSKNYIDRRVKLNYYFGCFYFFKSYFYIGLYVI